MVSKLTNIQCEEVREIQEETIPSIESLLSVVLLNSSIDTLAHLWSTTSSDQYNEIMGVCAIPSSRGQSLSNMEDSVTDNEGSKEVEEIPSSSDQPLSIMENSVTEKKESEEVHEIPSSVANSLSVEFESATSPDQMKDALLYPLLTASSLDPLPLNMESGTMNNELEEANDFMQKLSAKWANLSQTASPDPLVTAKQNLLASAALQCQMNSASTHLPSTVTANPSVHLPTSPDPPSVVTQNMVYVARRPCECSITMKKIKKRLRTVFVWSSKIFL